jgi:hypothetical protein
MDLVLQSMKSGGEVQGLDLPDEHGPHPREAQSRVSTACMKTPKQSKHHQTTCVFKMNRLFGAKNTAPKPTLNSAIANVLYTLDPPLYMDALTVVG